MFNLPAVDLEKVVNSNEIEATGRFSAVKRCELCAATAKTGKNSKRMLENSSLKTEKQKKGQTHGKVLH